MPATFTKAQASKLLNATEMRLYEESRINPLRKFSASQLDRRVERMRALRDKARDQLQRQRLALREATGSKRGERGTANQQRSKDKLALLADMLRRFEGQLKVARKKEAAGIVPKDAPQRRVGKTAAVSRVRAPGKDFTASRMRNRNRAQDEAGDAMRERKAAKSTTRKPAKSAVGKAASTGTAAAKKTPAHKAASRAPLPGGETRGKRTASARALSDAGKGAAHEGFADPRAAATARTRKFQDARLRPIQAHVSSSGRRTQARRDDRD